MKQIYKFFSVLLLSAVFLQSVAFAANTKDSLVLQQIDYTEASGQVVNPDKGFYTLLPMYRAGAAKELTVAEVESKLGYYCRQAISKGQSLTFFKILLKPVAEMDAIPQIDKANIEAYFDCIAGYGLKTVVRAAYDFDGASGQEPETIDIIYKHIEGLGEVYSRHTDVITVVETGLIGPWGEMHTSPQYLTDENLSGIVRKYLSCMDPDLQLSVRRPSYYRKIFGVESPINGETAFSGADEARVGIYNDGYLGSSSDLGTYREWTRAQELAFQDSHNRYLIFGGEAVLGDGYGTDASTAIEDMRLVHATYFNDGWDLKLHAYWQEETYSGQNAYDYIANHLGYRFVLREAYLPEAARAGEEMEISLQIENTGFANMIRNRQAEVVFHSALGTYSVQVDADPRFWQSGGITAETIRVKVPVDCTAGEWEVFLKLPDRSGNDACAVRFANTSGFNEELHANLVGRVSITEPEPLYYVFQLNSPRVYYSGTQTVFDAGNSCFLVDERAYLPVRVMANATSSEIDYYDKTQSIEITNRFGSDFAMTLGSSVINATLGGNSYVGEINPPLLINQSACLPVRETAMITGTYILYIPQEGIGYIVVASEEMTQAQAFSAVSAAREQM